MQNIRSYENFDRTNESSIYECGGISESAKEAIKSLCESVLCQEALDYHNDEDSSHTYEGYINECAGYIKECMGQAGYAPLIKPHAE